MPPGRPIGSWFVQIPVLMTAVLGIESIEDCAKLVGAIERFGLAPRRARPECEPGANQRKPNSHQRYAQSSHA